MSRREAESTGYELLEEVYYIGRTSKVLRGGRRFSFTAHAVVGDGQGKIGVGHGKATEVPVAIQKALQAARKNMKKVVLNGNTVQYTAIGKFSATKVFLRPASKGTGIIAGGAMRAVFTVLGVENVLAKVIGSTNPVNVVKATVKALLNMQTPQWVSAKRGLPVKQILEHVDG